MLPRVDLLALLLASNRFGDAQFVSEYAPVPLAEAYTDVVARMQVLESPGGGLFVFAPSRWDSDYFGFPVVRIHEWLGPDGQDHDRSLADLLDALAGARLLFLRIGAERQCE